MLCINTGALVSFKPEDLATSCLLLFLKSKLLNMEDQQIYKSYCSTSYVSPAARGRYTCHIDGQFHFGFILFLYR